MKPSSQDHRQPAPDTDEAAFEAFAREQDPVELEAATWAVRSRHGLDAAARAELDAWVRADARHGQAFEAMGATFGAVARMPRRLVIAPEAPTTAAPRSRSRYAFRPHAAAATLAFLVAGGAWFAWEDWKLRPQYERAFSTERGQQLAVTLPDAPAKGSLLQLDTASRLAARLYRDRREVRLEEGQAVFAVKSDPSRPFHVEAGALRITVVGTRFSVRHTTTGLEAGQTVVAVEEGRVRVTRTDLPDAAPIELAAGQAIAADSSGRVGAVAIVQPDAVGAWRRGRISFDQVPLVTALAEFERYGRTNVVVRDPSVAAMPVGGSYDLRQFHHFAESLPVVLPVKLVRQGDLIEIVRR